MVKLARNFMLTTFTILVVFVQTLHPHAVNQTTCLAAAAAAALLHPAQQRQQDASLGGRRTLRYVSIMPVGCLCALQTCGKWVGMQLERDSLQMRRCMSSSRHTYEQVYLC